MLICDTSGLLARYDPDDVAHPSAVATFDHATPPFVVFPLVLAEFDYLLRTRHPLAAAREVLADVAGSGYEHPSRGSVRGLHRGERQAIVKWSDC